MGAQSNIAIADMAAHYGMDDATFKKTLMATVLPPNTRPEEFATFLIVARQYGLNPVTREIYAMKRGNSPLQAIVGVDGWCSIINSNPMFDGMEFVDTLDAKGNLVSVTCRIHRKDRQHPVECTEYLAECVQPGPVWQRWPKRMLRHKALIQAARYAFSLSGIIDPDEADRYLREPEGKPKQTLREKLTTLAGPRTQPDPEPDDDDNDKDAIEIASPDLPSPYNTPEPTTYDAAEEDVDESEPEFAIDPASAAYRKGVADGQEKTGRCRSSKVLANPEMLANWRAGYESVAALDEPETAA